MTKSNLKGLFLRNWKIVAIIIAFTLTSCSSRKVQKSEIKVNETEQTQTAKVDTSKTVTKTETNTKVLDSSTTDEITIEPVDNTKEMVVDGKSYKLIAAELFVAHDTIKTHVKNIYAKLHVHSGTEAVSLALRDKIV